MTDFAVDPSDLEALRAEAFPDPEDGEAWSVWPHPDGNGHIAHHPTRGFGDTRFATELDAARAVLDSPFFCRLADGSFYGDAAVVDADVDAA